LFSSQTKIFSLVYDQTKILAQPGKKNWVRGFNTLFGLP
jgi:hypothetical protein